MGTMTSDNHETNNLNVQKSFALASVLFPSEEWIHTEANIWVAKSRLVQEKREPEKWSREMSQVRILTDRTHCLKKNLAEMGAQCRRIKK